MVRYDEESPVIRVKSTSEVDETRRSLQAGYEEYLANLALQQEQGKSKKRTVTKEVLTQACHKTN